MTLLKITWPPRATNSNFAVEGKTTRRRLKERRTKYVRTYVCTYVKYHESNDNDDVFLPYCIVSSYYVVSTFD